MKKIRSFTLVELLIAMVLSTIVITLSYRVLDNLQWLYHHSSAQNEILNEIMLVQNLINKDCAQAPVAVFSPGQFAIKRLDQSEVTYSFSEHEIIRNEQGKVDTFRVGPMEFDVQYLFSLEPYVETLNISVSLTKSELINISANIAYSNRQRLILEGKFFKQE